MSWPGWKVCLGAIVPAMVFAQGLWGTMGAKIVEEKEFWIIGIEARTNNAKEVANDGVIGKQWERFFREGILEKIPNKVDATIFAVYTDYASDRNGDYSYVLGVRVNDITKVPAGMVAKKVPAGKYAVLISATGPVTKIVPEAWQRVWDLEDKSQLGGSRAYRADFEVYDQRSKDPQDSEVDIYVGIK